MIYLSGWRDGSVKSTGCSSRGPEFNSQHPHGGSQSSIMGSDVLFCHKGICVNGALIYTKINKRSFKNYMIYLKEIVFMKPNTMYS